MKKSKEIKGITIDDTEYRWSQYADDTSLILDGSPASLGAPLRLLQFYAEISGLIINFEKTNVIWIGSKKHSQDKICVKWGLKWSSSTFKLLGITFSVDLDQMIVLNYKPRLKEIENTINRWSKETLTPFEKNSIIKTLIISKLNHLFLAIPGPDENMIRQLTSKIYSFIWDDKPDKVKRYLISQDYCWGGLTMINLKAFIQGLKLTWVRKLFHSESNWVKLYKYNEQIDFTELTYLGPVKASKNKFWEEVFDSWNILKELHLPRYPVSTVYYKNWANGGIWTVNDL